ncbi:MAG: cytochrome c oxidase subunit II [Pseudomonadota bacterium]
MTRFFGICATLFASVTPAFAQQEPQNLESIGVPVERGISFQPSATELMADLVWLDNYLLVIITAISVFVVALLIWCVIRYNKRMNPTPSRFTHNTALEITWTVVPVLILIAIMPPSLTLLFKQMEIPEADVTIKATGYQWYWGHEYVDHGFAFDSIMLERDELAEFGYADNEYLLATDTAVVIPTGQNVVIQVTGADVIHAWTIPAFGVKQDAIPGRLAEIWFNVDEGKEGVYFGQCSELCGINHAYMPITVKAVTQAEYEAWLDGAIAHYGGIPRDVDVAENQ